MGDQHGTRCTTINGANQWNKFNSNTLRLVHSQNSIKKHAVKTIFRFIEWSPPIFVFVKMFQSMLEIHCIASFHQHRNSTITSHPSTSSKYTTSNRSRNRRRHRILGAFLQIFKLHLIESPLLRRRLRGNSTTNSSNIRALRG